MELAIVTTMLLGSYGLLAFPGLDYQRHFKGAKTIVDALQVHKSTTRLARASFWIYARHEVGEALNMSSPTRQDPTWWPRLDLSESELRGDSYCNEAVRICAETACFAFGDKAATKSRKRAKERILLEGELDRWLENCPNHWKGLKYDENGVTRYWFPCPNFGNSHKSSTRFGKY